MKMSLPDNAWIFNHVNNNRTGKQRITPENAKQMYFPLERLSAGKRFGEKAVNDLFGEPSHLEKAEMLLLEIEKYQISKVEKYNNIARIAYFIVYACDMNLDSDNSVYQKYEMLHKGIPIQLSETNKDETISFLNIKKVEKKIEVDLLEKMLTRIDLNLHGEVPLDAEQEAYFDYIFALVYSSLKNIFKEVKAEIIGEE